MLLADHLHNRGRRSRSSHVLVGGEGHHNTTVHLTAVIGFGLVRVLGVEGMRDILMLTLAQFNYVRQQEGLANGLTRSTFT